MKKLLMTVAVVAAADARAQGFTRTYGLGTGTVVVSNGQANSSWVTVAVMIRYPGPRSGTAEVRRLSQGMDICLGWCSFTNVTSVVWVPDSLYSFSFGDALVIGSSVTNGFVQVTRRGD
jgi:hypothetical protein